ncbi:hypothetical protein DVU_2027 [Nitratidesulfovibrio vulgaris str. Hildenborough]|uniref:Uncharacterized protein n=1 Tax=Nitratidesulfovibrio vulgaris (strain ATCC 29579 / DSM 644 / CCUG 34227 / NCIMB 8303 / VKM B-1760 / Hildenborough) TaxID=882 RepID=Q72AG8_NITV2|nr:hypothetical protein DVU_2027 [Nitratidesulfovibrio vulgaris str. Hildenborough]
MSQFASRCGCDLVQFQVPFGFPVEEGIKIFVGQISFQCDVTLSKHFDGKISNKSVPTTNCEPKEIRLLLVASTNKECKFVWAKRPQSREYLAEDSFERIQCSGL